MIFPTDPEIEQFVNIHEDFVGNLFTNNQSSCVYVYTEELNGLNLTCTASKPTDVIPELRVIWIQNSIESISELYHMENNTVTTSTLALNSTELNASGNYTCLADLLIPDSLNITKSIVFNETVFKGKPNGIMN